MVSPELIRRYPFFSGLDYDQLVKLAKVASTETLEADYYVFREEDDLQAFYLVVEGAVAIVLEVPDQDAKQTIAGQLSGQLKTKSVTVSTVGTGDVFGWSGLIAPHTATAGAKTITPCKVIAFDRLELEKVFEEDCRFGFIMVQKGAQVIRERLRDIRIESLAFLTT